MYLNLEPHRPLSFCLCPGPVMARHAPIWHRKFSTVTTTFYSFARAGLLRQHFCRFSVVGAPCSPIIHLEPDNFWLQVRAMAAHQLFSFTHPKYVIDINEASAFSGSTCSNTRCSISHKPVSHVALFLTIDTLVPSFPSVTGL